MSTDTYTLQDLLTRIDALAVSPAEKQELKAGIVQVIANERSRRAKPQQAHALTRQERVSQILDEIIDLAEGSRDYFGICPCVMNLHLPEDATNDGKLIRVAEDVVYHTDDHRIRPKILELTDQLKSLANTTEQAYEQEDDYER